MDWFLPIKTAIVFLNMKTRNVAKRENAVGSARKITYAFSESSLIPEEKIMKSKFVTVLAVTMVVLTALTIVASEAQAGCVVVATGEPCTWEWSWGMVGDGFSRLGQELITFFMSL
ncbi:MAG TPA: hypothetical protein VFV50_11710 [Bdellovibrionales bacterium]|nr:hypothetical protein [Bdellovibrionales bacterium]